MIRSLDEATQVVRLGASAVGLNELNDRVLGNGGNRKLDMKLDKSIRESILKYTKKTEKSRCIPKIGFPPDMFDISLTSPLTCSLTSLL